MNTSDAPRDDGRPLGALLALQRLRDGNLRFVQNVRSVDSMLSHAARRSLVSSQVPVAIVLSCSDSRAPAELVFDQGLGDLFVVRVAGNVVAPSLVGSIEFAAATFGTELVVVMGHTHCGAITATFDGVAAGIGASENVLDLIGRVQPSIDAARRANPSLGRDALLAAATRANAVSSAEQLRRGSPLLGELSARGRLVIVAAVCSLETGAVQMLDRAPA